MRAGRTRRAAVLCLGVCMALLAPAAAPADIDPVSRYFDSIRNEPRPRAAFLRDMPKGGDLHIHLSGAVSTETLVRFAIDDDWCLDTTSFQASPRPCGPGQRPAADTNTDTAFYDRVISAWSMKGFVPGSESGHDHFFATFGKFSPVMAGHTGRMLAEVAARAASQNEFYL